MVVPRDAAVRATIVPPKEPFQSLLPPLGPGNRLNHFRGEKGKNGAQQDFQSSKEPGK
jgi:hypothetical protein